MTPIIDVVFNLLIFFLLASQFARVERDQSINVVAVNDIQPVAEMPNNLVVNVHADGHYSVMGVAHTLESLDKLIAARAKDADMRQVIIRPDAEASCKAAAGVMDLCNKHKVGSIGFSLAQTSESALGHTGGSGP
ncbi:MAG: hypothetical protein BIFFINMI_02980 [Phycisphaerae bacterium]|nr:hypothetical protein [Phycisphaerae bacterium]